MKVTQAGSLVVLASGRLVSEGWRYVLEPGERYADRDSPECQRAVLSATLDYIAKVNGIGPEGDASVPIAVERAALDAIAIARWSPQ